MKKNNFILVFFPMGMFKKIFLKSQNFPTYGGGWGSSEVKYLFIGTFPMLQCIWNLYCYQVWSMNLKKMKKKFTFILLLRLKLCFFFAEWEMRRISLKQTIVTLFFLSILTASLTGFTLKVCKEMYDMTYLYITSKFSIILL